MEKFLPNQRIGYAKIKVTPTLMENGRITIKEVLGYLQSNYSEKEIAKERYKTNHLPFPFKTEKLEKTDFNVVSSDFSQFVMKSFINYDGEWDKKQEMIDNFELDLAEISKCLNEYQIIYPCYILNIEDFYTKSDKVHALFNDMEGFIFEYYYFVLFATNNRGLLSVEIALD